MRFMVIGWLFVISVMVAGFATSTDYIGRASVRTVRAVVVEGGAP